MVSEFPHGLTPRTRVSTGAINVVRHACWLRRKATRCDMWLLLVTYIVPELEHGIPARPEAVHLASDY